MMEAAICAPLGMALATDHTQHSHTNGPSSRSMQSGTETGRHCKSVDEKEGVQVSV